MDIIKSALTCLAAMVVAASPVSAFAPMTGRLSTTSDVEAVLEHEELTYQVDEETGCISIVAGHGMFLYITATKDGKEVRFDKPGKIDRLIILITVDHFKKGVDLDDALDGINYCNEHSPYMHWLQPDGQGGYIMVLSREMYLTKETRQEELRAMIVIHLARAKECYKALHH